MIPDLDIPDLDALEGDLIVIQKELLPDARKSLAWLTRPDYKPEDNPDHDCRDQDIESLQAEVVEMEHEEQKLITQIKKKELWLKKHPPG